MQTQADTGIGPVSCKNCSVFKKGEGGPEAPGALRLRNKKATASVASSYSQNTPVIVLAVLGPHDRFVDGGFGHCLARVSQSESPILVNIVTD